MKKCPKCKTENPQQANFCRGCGKQFENRTKEETQIINNSHNGQTDHILDSLRPVNDADFDYFDEDAFANMFGAVVCLFGAPIGVFFVTMGEGMFIAPFLEIPVVVYMICKITRWIILKNKFKKNVDFIEDGGSIVRVARRNLMGLYERPHNVILKSQYSIITAFDENHFLLEQNGKKGLYSKTYKKIIVPVQYDSLSHFENYITTAVVGGVKELYDVKGNKW